MNQHTTDQHTSRLNTRSRPSRRRVVRHTALLAASALIFAACDDGGGRDDSASSTGTNATATEGASRVFRLQLSEGAAEGTTTATTPLVEGDPLDADRLAEIVSRLPEWLRGSASQEEFNWPTQTTPPPRTGRVVEGVFPPDTSLPPDTTTTGPLHVVRYQPEGEVTIAPYIAITFDQPMVPVSTVSQLDAIDVPVQITPAIEGRWQWIGTRTLRFDATDSGADRLAMATEYTVTVPKGTESANGGTLAADVTFTFTTPPVTVQSLSPQGESLALDQLFVATFDQRVDPAAVLATIRLIADGDDVAIRLATAEEVAADDNARMVSENALEGRWLAFRPEGRMPTDANLRITIGPDTPSAEGTRLTTEAATFDGRTYAPLKIVRTSCAYGEECPPGSAVYVEFNNVLDAAKSDAGAVSISPALAGMTSSVQGSTLVISGATQARTEYTITVPGSFTDMFGQALGDDTKVKVRIGNAQPSIQELGTITTLDPFAATQQVSVWTVGHDTVRVRAFAANPADFADYSRYLYQRDDERIAFPDWTQLSDATITIDGDRDQMVVTDLDLAEVLKGSPGQVILLVEPVPAVKPSSNDYWQNRPAVTWVQSTTLGLDAVADASNLHAWVTDLRTGAPREGVELSMIAGAGAGSGTTADDGTAVLELPTSSNSDGLVALVASDGDETAIITTYATRTTLTDQVRWYVFDDRQVYQPGETMRVKGWVRRLATATDASVGALRSATSVDYSVFDSYGNEVLKGSAELTGLGGFDLDLEIPESADLGSASLQLTLVGEGGLDGTQTYHSFQIQQYRRPEFEVSTRPESEGPYVSTRPATVAATAAYYAGGPLVDSPVDWLVSTSPATYSPPGWSDFTFGVWVPWWYEGSGRGLDYGGDIYYGDTCCGPVGDTETATYSGTTDSSGTHYLQLGFEAQDGSLPDLPVSVTAEATVTDVNRQAWSSSTSLLVHAADRYVGLRSSRTFVRQGDPLEIETVVTGIDGDSISDVTFDVVAGRVEWKFENGEYTESVVDPQTCTITSGGESDACSFDTEVGGQYKITAVVAGTGSGASAGRNRSELTVWVSGAESRPTRGVEQQELTVVPDKATYAPGDTAELLVQAPFATGEGLFTVSHNGIRSTQRFTIADGSAVVSVPITEADIPSLSLSFEVVGATVRTGDDGTPLPDAPQRPAYAVGSMTLSVPPVSRTLTVDAVPRDTEVMPGGSTTIDVTVTDANGAPVQGAEFAVVVVDEAVLALSGYALADPLGVFYTSGYDYLQAVYGRSQIQLVDPLRLLADNNAGGDDQADGATEGTSTAGGGVADEDGAPPTTMAGMVPQAAEERAAGDDSYSQVDPVQVRSNFDALALFEPTVTTGANGTAAIPLTLPDNLTRYRVMVVAVSGEDRFGSAESNLTARLPLSVRPSAPRFANFGDEFELPLVVQNQTDEPLTVDVVLETDNLLPALASGRTVTVPANDRIEVRFPVSTEEAGDARFRATVVSGALADSATVSLPVYTPATAEAFATYGTVDGGSVDGGAVAQPLLTPDGVIEQFGGLEITTSSTSLQALTDAVLYLLDYPYDSADAHASRLMSIAALRDVLDAFDVEGLPAPTEIEAAAAADIEALVNLQNGDGGWSWWRRGERSDPWLSVEAAHSLVMARSEGYTVPESTMSMALQFLTDIESYIPAEWGETARDTVRAYALWVRNLAGSGDAAKAAQMYRDHHEHLGVDALAWLWTAAADPGISAEIERTLSNRAVETAGTANFTTDYGDGAYMVMHSDRRSDGIVLDALITNTPDSDLITKVVNGLLANKVKGRWDNVQENAFILLALKHYFDEFESATPDFLARVWLGDRFAGQHQFTGRSTDRASISIPMTDVVNAGDTDLVVSKTGTGRLYYRIGLRYAPDDLTLDALDRGFVVARVYEAVDDPGDVTLDADGVWHIKAGARVRVKLTMVAESQRTHVALIDPLPAGLESLNPTLAVTQTVPDEVYEGSDGSGSGSGDVLADYAPRSWWWGTWYEHQQLRDDRTEAFTTYLPAGVYTYSYVARATTPGTFVVPPTRAEEMYAPETFGRAASDRVVIE